MQQKTWWGKNSGWKETKHCCKICVGSGVGEGLLLLNSPREAIFIQDKLCSGAGTNIVLATSSFDNQGERGCLEQHAFKHLLLSSPRWCLSSEPWKLHLAAGEFIRQQPAVTEHSVPPTSTED